MSAKRGLGIELTILLFICLVLVTVTFIGYLHSKDKLDYPPATKSIPDLYYRGMEGRETPEKFDVWQTKIGDNLLTVTSFKCKGNGYEEFLLAYLNTESPKTVIEGCWVFRDGQFTFTTKDGKDVTSVPMDRFSIRAVVRAGKDQV